MIEFEIGDRVQVLTSKEMLKQEGVHENCGVILDNLPGSPGFVLGGMEHLCGEVGTVIDYTNTDSGRQVRVVVDFDNKDINKQVWHYAPFMFKKIKEAKAGFDDLPELSSLYGGVYED